MTTLTSADLSLLAALEEGPADAGTLGDAADRDPDAVADRLATLADDDLVERTDAGWRLRDSGRRALRAPGDATADDRIDLPDDVVAAVEALDLRADCEDAVLSVLATVETAGDAPRLDVREAVYPEAPAGHDDPETWWTECVAPALEAVGAVTVGDDGRVVYENDGSTSSR